MVSSNYFQQIQTTPKIKHNKNQNASKKDLIKTIKKKQHDVSSFIPPLIFTKSTHHYRYHLNLININIINSLIIDE
ncbi:Uncharacterised protein [Cedecea neteri]|uniref:Uncharacterized protein n=1 Tax=Cedecea neteri TaxID=158822 RepID=A0A2X2SY72_9ENTR|nr:Uncharacterised protein [Cedecea neteri]